MQNEMCLQQLAAMNGELATRICGLLMQQILDLRETLSFYEHELFPPTPTAATESALACPQIVAQSASKLNFLRKVSAPDTGCVHISNGAVGHPIRGRARTAPLERNSIYAGTQAGLRPTPAAPLRLPGTAHAGTTIDDVTAKGRRAQS